MISLAQRIAELRAKKQLTSQGLAQELGFPRQAIDKYEQGKQTPSKDHQQKLADFFGVSTAYLRGETNDPLRMDSFLDMIVMANEEIEEKPTPKKIQKPLKKEQEEEGGAMLDSLLLSPKVKEQLGGIILEQMKSPEIDAHLRRLIREELKKLK